MMDRQSIGAHIASVVLEQLHAEPAERDLRDAQGRFSYRSLGLDTLRRGASRDFTCTSLHLFCIQGECHIDAPT